MQLDNKEQRELLVKIIESASVGGSYKEIKHTVAVFDKLLEAIRKAEIKDDKKGS